MLFCMSNLASSAPAALASLIFDPLEPQISGNIDRIKAFVPFRVPASSFLSRFLGSDRLTSFLLLPDPYLCCSNCPHGRKLEF